MGVPKFFRYISERYPCLSELARDQNIPEFDNLYLDMNGIIHNCSHPDDGNVHFHITEEDMFHDIFNYIDKLFFLINPQKLFFMAVDGVAPRAKMNQQRSRRFRSAKEGELLRQKAISRGEALANEPFDSNCITPGTEFMARLHEALQYFIKSKISSNPLWQKCRVILSGHNTPGEGEHKIMDYIRYLKSQKDYDENTRHCLYGLDADLIILGLCTHELHFVVLREEVKFGRKAKKAAVEETRFFLLHLGLFREYLEMEFDELFKQKPDFDTAMLIDDWILMGFLVGNDFIPHLPYLHINTNALPLLYKTYIKVFPTLGGNINENGKLNLERLEKYFEALAEVEMELFRESYADLKYFEDKQSKNDIDEAFDFDVRDIKAEDAESDLAVFIESSKQFFEDDNGSFDEQEQILQEFNTYKRNYYMKKLNQTDMSSELKREQAIGYVTALQWILDYYYRGVQSWNWYYPHHYAPFISDLKDFKHHHIQFNMGKPFLPFEQLLAVLPAASRQLLPAPYRELMTSDSSELLHFYPNDFETDLNGKKQEWEAVVLIPFINENILLKAMKPFQHKLTAKERERNTHGPMLQYDYNPLSQGSLKGIYSFSTLKQVLCTENKIWSDEIKTSDKTVCVEVESATPRVLLRGFPTMKHLKYDFQIKMSRVKVFDHASRNESLILMPQDRPEYNDIFIVAEKFLNKVVYIGWPYLIKAMVIAVSSKEKNITSDGVEYMEPKVFQLQSKSLQEHFITRMGIEFSNFSVLVHVKTHIGTTYACGSHGSIITKDSWSSTVTAYPAQGLVSDTSVYSNVPCGNMDIESIFPVDSQIFFVGNPYFGAEGKVVNPLMIYECGRLKINITVLPEPDLSVANYVQNQLQSDYINSFEASVLTGIPVKCLGRLTGSILVVTGPKRSNVSESTPKTNIGLQLKFPKQQEERAGYARRVGVQWYYSSKAVGILKLYCSKYPAVVEYLAKSSSRAEFIFESDLFPNNVGEGLIEKISSWLKDQHHMNAERITCGTQTAEKESVQIVLNAVEKLKDLPLKTVRLQVKPHLLLKPDVSLPEVYKSKRDVALFDRVVVVKSTYMVPVGARGTVVGIQPVADPNPVRLECLKKIENFLDILFDKHLPNTNSIHGIAHERVYKVPESSVLLTYNQDIKQNESLHNNIPASADVKGKATSLATFNPTNNFQANICDVLPPTNMKQLYPPSQPCLRTARNYTAEDFWMPSANAKVQHFTQIAPEVKPSFIYNPTPISTNSSLQIMPEVIPILASHPTINAQPQNSNYSTYNDCKAGTQVLKNLLGITGNNTDSSRIHNKPANYMNLPVPPLNWRLSSVDSNVKHRSDNLAPLTTQAPKKVPDIDENCIRSIATYNANAMSPTIADKGQTVKNILTLPPERLFNSGSLSQKGAFIPIQGNLSTSTRHNRNDFIAVNSIANEECSRSDAATITTATRENNVDTSMRNELSTEQLQRRIKPPRTPKIAAKFDNVPE